MILDFPFLDKFFGQSRVRRKHTADMLFTIPLSEIVFLRSIMTKLYPPAKYAG